MSPRGCALNNSTRLPFDTNFILIHVSYDSLRMVEKTIKANLRQGKDNTGI